MNDVLLTALVQALTQWAGTPAWFIDVEGHGREALFDDVDLSRTVGWFTTLFPVLLELPSAVTPEQALFLVQERLRRLPHHGIGYGLLRYLSRDGEMTQTLCILPRAEVCFNYLGQLDHVLPESSLFALAQESSGPSQSARGLRPYLLEVNASVVSKRLQLRWTYSEQVHRRETIAGLAQRCLLILRDLLTPGQSDTADVDRLVPFPLAQLGQDQLERAFGEIVFEGEEA